MKKRTYRRCLPAGWYPVTEDETRTQLGLWNVNDRKYPVVSCIVPHAGWFFSGELCYRVFSAFDYTPDIIVIAGGHLRQNDLPQLLDYDIFETALGDLGCAYDLVSHLKQEFEFSEHDDPDNTVEIQLPFIKHFFPESLIVSLRVPPHPGTGVMARSLGKLAQAYDKKIALCGSTDLTHYGPAYNLDHATGLKESERWVKRNDRAFIDCCLEYDSDGILEKSDKNSAACSGGAALMAMEFAKETGSCRSMLLKYSTSLEKHVSDSFVGYCGILYF